jgi:hypothetical protein
VETEGKIDGGAGDVAEQSQSEHDRVKLATDMRAH